MLLPYFLFDTPGENAPSASCCIWEDGRSPSFQGKPAAHMLPVFCLWGVWVTTSWILLLHADVQKQNNNNKLFWVNIATHSPNKPSAIHPHFLPAFFWDYCWALSQFILRAESHFSDARDLPSVGESLLKFQNKAQTALQERGGWCPSVIFYFSSPQHLPELFYSSRSSWNASGCPLNMSGRGLQRHLCFPHVCLDGRVFLWT